LRRIEDAAVADDPLLHMRLGLPLTPTARAVAKTRRAAKALGRWSTARVGWPLLMLAIVVFALTIALAHSFALASWLASPCAFLLGVVVARRRETRPAAPELERRRHLGQST
jgi:hypothetical protein